MARAFPLYKLRNPAGKQSFQRGMLRFINLNFTI